MYTTYTHTYWTLKYSQNLHTHTLIASHRWYSLEVSQQVLESPGGLSCVYSLLTTNIGLVKLCLSHMWEIDDSKLLTTLDMEECSIMENFKKVCVCMCIHVWLTCLMQVFSLSLFGKNSLCLAKHFLVTKCVATITSSVCYNKEEYNYL